MSKTHEIFAARAAEIGDTAWAYADNPVQFWDLFGEQGHPIRTTVSEMGPLLLSRLMDLIWAFPVYLLAISLSTVLLTTPGGVSFGPITLDPSSLWMPTLIIALIYIPYVFRPVRGQVLSVREKEYVEAGVSQGASSLRLMLSEILPNVVSTVIVLLPLMIATTVLTEAALSFLSIGVQPPNASWGTIIGDGQELLYTRPWVAIAPGIMIVLTVLSLNVLGDGIRDALDPRAKVRVRE